MSLGSVIPSYNEPEHYIPSAVNVVIINLPQLMLTAENLCSDNDNISRFAREVYQQLETFMMK